MKKTKLFIKENSTLRDFQKYAEVMEKERGFEKETILEQCLLLGEEIGELFKAVRKNKTKISFDNENSRAKEVSYEMADIMMYLFCLANRLNVDLEEAIKKKEEINKQRKWN
jgi:NTP pyrophosphatase (non-canonical NTP hydrolase)